VGEPRRQHDRLEVGRVGRAHGLRGEVAVSFVSDREERRTAGAVMYAGERVLTVVSARPHRHRWLLRFAGVDDRSAAEELRGAVLVADPIEGDTRTLWVHEMVGAEMVDRQGRTLGRVAAVQANPAHELLVLEDGALVPSVFVVSRTPGAAGSPARVVVEVPEGLLEP
jgi:16S rRNA processing protein RimM